MRHGRLARFDGGPLAVEIGHFLGTQLNRPRLQGSHFGDKLGHRQPALGRSRFQRIGRFLVDFDGGGSDVHYCRIGLVVRAEKGPRRTG
jgi:hypothetical protein